MFAIPMYLDWRMKTLSQTLTAKASDTVYLILCYIDPKHRKQLFTSLPLPVARSPSRISYAPFIEADSLSWDSVWYLVLNSCEINKISSNLDGSLG